MSDRVFRLFFGFGSLAWEVCVRGCFSFLFLYVIPVGVVNALIKGEIEDQVCLRTSGGSLLSDE